MSDQGEKTCPLCAEEMDLTDQQLKPCKCGYEICVWCWHHIMDMAEKDKTDGRCPACRTPYDKAKIVGMAAKCERLVSEVNMEKRKTQKPKTKPSDGRKQLSSVRVIQRNLVYIVGLPLNFADEDLLQRKEYFGQYGKVLKVSMSRTASGVIQQFPNNTCSVYITYSKEEEAIRCIQSVHGFTLDGRCLKACFGTTKYCHAWLRSLPCSNPDCLYLHEVGPQEDSFTKDEIISAYTRSRVQQITGVTNSLQRRSGNMLPPPKDEYCSNTSTAKPIVKKDLNISPSVPKSSPPNGSCGRPVALPAAASWGTRASNQQSESTMAISSNGSSKQKAGAVNGTLVFSSAVASTTHVPVSRGVLLKSSFLEEDGQTVHTNGKLDLSTHSRQSIPSGSQKAVSGRPASADRNSTNNLLSYSKATACGDRAGIQSNVMDSLEGSEQSCGYVHAREDGAEVDERIDTLCASVSSMSVDTNGGDEHAGLIRPSSSFSDHGRIAAPGGGGAQQQLAQKFWELSHGQAASKDATSVNGLCFAGAERDWRSVSQDVETNTLTEVDEDVLSFDNRRLKDPAVENTAPDLASSVSFSHSSWCRVNPSSDLLSLNNTNNDQSHRPNSFAERLVVESTSTITSIDRSHLFPSEGNKENQIGNSLGETDGSDIISNILSLDFDPWDEPLGSPQNLAKLFSETNKRVDPLKLSNARKVHNTNQSRFSFAREEESSDPTFDADPHAFGGQHRSATRRGSYLDKFGISNGFSSNYSEKRGSFSSNPTFFSSDKLSVSRTQTSAPPGFSVPNRSPPPGFSLNERKDQSFDAMCGSRLLESASLLRNSYQASPAVHFGGPGDIEFMDPAILAVGRGRLQGGLDNAGLDVRSHLSPQLNALENEARLQLLLQQSVSGNQCMRFHNATDNLSCLVGSYGIPSGLMNHSQGNIISTPFTQHSRQQSANSLLSNGHWDGWNEVRGGSSAGMAELLRDERLGYSTFYTGHDDSKFPMPTSGDLYNRMYRM